MAKLIYSMLTSLDGYVSDASGNFDWSAPAEDIHAFVNELSRSFGTYLYGRRMYEVMKFWGTAHTVPDLPAVFRDYADVWQATDKIVYSSSLENVESERTRIERTFDPEAVRRLKAESDRDLTVDGPHLAAQAIRAGLVDEYQLYVNPTIVGGGNRFFPDGVHVDLELLDDHRFSNGVVYLRYAVKSAES